MMTQENDAVEEPLETGISVLLRSIPFSPTKLQRARFTGLSALILRASKSTEKLTERAVTRVMLSPYTPVSVLYASVRIGTTPRVEALSSTIFLS